MNRVQKQIKRARQAGLTNNDIWRMKEIAKKQAKAMQNEAVEMSFLFMLAIPLNVLVADYWPKAPKKKLEKFIDDVISLYESVQEGVVSPEELNDFLEDMVGVCVTADWIKERKKNVLGLKTGNTVEKKGKKQNC